MVGIKSLKEVPKNCIECPYGICLGSISFCPILGDDEIDIQENMLKGTRYEYCPLTEIEERKVGKWIEVWESQRDEFSGEYDEWREHKCSICDFQEMDADRFNFCPNCGAEMRGAENG